MYLVFFGSTEKRQDNNDRYFSRFDINLGYRFVNGQG